MSEPSKVRTPDVSGKLPSPYKLAQVKDDAVREFIRRACSSSIRDALGGGTAPERVLLLLAEEVALATGGDAQQLLLKAAGIPGIEP